MLINLIIVIIIIIIFYFLRLSYRSPMKEISSSSPKKDEPYIIDGENCIPLMHSVSFYRRQQSQVS